MSKLESDRASTVEGKTMSDVQTTIFGYVGGEIAFSEGGARGDHATFRVGSTPRLYDKNNGGWRDGETIWTTVSCWRALAGNVKSSVHIGDPVVVIGKRRVNTWTDENGEKREREFVDAITVCHDLARGTSVFRRTPRISERVEEPDQLSRMLDAAEQSTISEESDATAGGEAAA